MEARENIEFREEAFTITEAELISSYDKMKELDLIDPYDQDRMSSVRWRFFFKQIMIFGGGLFFVDALQQMKLIRKRTDNRRFMVAVSLIPTFLFTFLRGHETIDVKVELDEKYKPLYKQFLINRNREELEMDHLRRAAASQES